MYFLKYPLVVLVLLGKFLLNYTPLYAENTLIHDAREIERILINIKNSGKFSNELPAQEDMRIISPYMFALIHPKSTQEQRDLFKNLGKYIGFPDEEGNLEIDGDILSIFRKILGLQPDAIGKVNLLTHSQTDLDEWKLFDNSSNQTINFEIAINAYQKLTERMNKLVIEVFSDLGSVQQEELLKRVKYNNEMFMSGPGIDQHRGIKYFLMILKDSEINAFKYIYEELIKKFQEMQDKSSQDAKEKISKMTSFHDALRKLTSSFETIQKAKDVLRAIEIAQSFDSGSKLDQLKSRIISVYPRLSPDFTEEPVWASQDEKEQELNNLLNKLKPRYGLNVEIDESYLQSLMQPVSTQEQRDLFKDLGKFIGFPDEEGDLSIDEDIVSVFKKILWFKPGVIEKVNLIGHTETDLDERKLFDNDSDQPINFEIAIKAQRKLSSRMINLVKYLHSDLDSEKLGELLSRVKYNNEMFMSGPGKDQHRGIKYFLMFLKDKEYKDFTTIYKGVVSKFQKDRGILPQDQTQEKAKKIQLFQSALNKLSTSFETPKKAQNILKAIEIADSFGQGSKFEQLKSRVMMLYPSLTSDSIEEFLLANRDDILNQLKDELILLKTKYGLNVEVTEAYLQSLLKAEITEEQRELFKNIGKFINFYASDGGYHIDEVITSVMRKILWFKSSAMEKINLLEYTEMDIKARKIFDKDSEEKITFGMAMYAYGELTGRMDRLVSTLYPDLEPEEYEEFKRALAHKNNRFMMGGEDGQHRGVEFFTSVRLTQNEYQIFVKLLQDMFDKLQRNADALSSQERERKTQEIQLYQEELRKLTPQFETLEKAYSVLKLIELASVYAKDNRFDALKSRIYSLYPDLQQFSTP